MVGLGKRLYALGGMQDGGFTSLVEMYDTESNEWHNVENMGEARCNPGKVGSASLFAQETS